MGKLFILLGIGLASVTLAGCQQKQEEPLCADRIEVFALPPVEKAGGLNLSSSEQESVAHGQEFALELLEHIAAGRPGESFAVSPLSLQMAFALLMNAAAGTTLEEIESVLSSPSGPESEDAINALYQRLLRDLPCLDPDHVTLRMNNLVVVNGEYRVAVPFREIAHSRYYAPVVNESFRNPAEILSLVNTWSAENTEGHIPEILDSLSPETLALLLNALYFKGEWSDGPMTPVDDLKFVREDGCKMVLPSAGRQGSFMYGEDKTKEWVELAYGSGAYVMDILLPKNGHGVSELLSEFGREGTALFSAGRRERVDVRIPEFETDSSLDLLQILSGLGLSEALSTHASYPYLVEESEGPFVSRVLQKVYFGCNRNGTEAASTTVILMKDSSSGETEDAVLFTADHPFVYLIREKETGIILFSGVFQGI